jgi:hypothetical protein
MEWRARRWKRSSTQCTTLDNMTMYEQHVTIFRHKIIVYLRFDEI